mmetsp:Transcript_45586/g.99104  ORF Transcript_45586/g.99104 Transcript_45586/m.99104 type:complete len:369 (+) Transcript_45586:3-1109(+)
MAAAIGRVTASLFPPHAIVVSPVPGVPATQTRIMAGYMLYLGDVECVMLFYCELHANSGGEARMVLYSDEGCEREMMTVFLTDTSVVCTRKGAYCTVFGVDTKLFCARSIEEKDLWLRAVSNVKVKLMFDAPDPSDEELAMYRAAVMERVEALPHEFGTAAPCEKSLREGGALSESSAVGKTAVGEGPLLAVARRQPMPAGLQGDVWLPEPMEEIAVQQPFSAPPWLTSGKPVTKFSEDRIARHPDEATDADDDDDHDDNDKDLQGRESGRPAATLCRSSTPVPLPNEITDGRMARELLRSVGVDDVGAAPEPSGSVAAEEPGLIRTVHTTRKSLLTELSCRPLLPEAHNIPLLAWSPGPRHCLQRAL